MKGFDVFEELQNLRNEFLDYHAEIRIEVNCFSGEADVRFVLYSGCYDNKHSSMFTLDNTIDFNEIKYKVEYAKNSLRRLVRISDE